VKNRPNQWFCQEGVQAWYQTVMNYVSWTLVVSLSNYEATDPGSILSLAIFPVWPQRSESCDGYSSVVKMPAVKSNWNFNCNFSFNSWSLISQFKSKPGCPRQVPQPRPKRYMLCLDLNMAGNCKVKEKNSQLPVARMHFNFLFVRCYNDWKKFVPISATIAVQWQLKCSLLLNWHSFHTVLFAILPY